MSTYDAAFCTNEWNLGCSDHCFLGSFPKMSSNGTWASSICEDRALRLSEFSAVPRMTLFLRSSDRRVDSTVVWRRARSWSIRAGFVSTSLDVEEVEVVGLSLPRLNGSVFCFCFCFFGFCGAFRVFLRMRPCCLRRNLGPADHCHVLLILYIQLLATPIHESYHPPGASHAWFGQTDWLGLGIRVGYRELIGTTP